MKKKLMGAAIGVSTACIVTAFAYQLNSLETKVDLYEALTENQAKVIEEYREVNSLLDKKVVVLEKTIESHKEIEEVHIGIIKQQKAEIAKLKK